MPGETWATEPQRVNQYWGNVKTAPMAETFSIPMLLPNTQCPITYITSLVANRNEFTLFCPMLTLRMLFLVMASYCCGIVLLLLFEMTDIITNAEVSVWALRLVCWHSFIVSMTTQSIYYFSSLKGKVNIAPCSEWSEGEHKGMNPVSSP